jgi:hypothetical protein
VRKRPRKRAKAKAELNRWDCPGIVCIGDRVIWDGEAEYLGLEPLTHWPPRAASEVEPGPKGKGRASGPKIVRNP